MKIHQVKSPPHYDGDACNLDSEIKEKLGRYSKHGFDVLDVWYWYSSSDYEGAGEMVVRMRDDDGEAWFACNLNHCSCYGPFDDLPSIPRGIEYSYKQLHSRFTKEFAKNFVEITKSVERILKARQTREEKARQKRVAENIKAQAAWMAAHPGATCAWPSVSNFSCASAATGLPDMIPKGTLGREDV